MKEEKFGPGKKYRHLLFLNKCTNWTENSAKYDLQKKCQLQEEQRSTAKIVTCSL